MGGNISVDPKQQILMAARREKLYGTGTLDINDENQGMFNNALNDLNIETKIDSNIYENIDIEDIFTESDIESLAERADKELEAIAGKVQSTLQKILNTPSSNLEYPAITFSRAHPVN